MSLLTEIEASTRRPGTLCAVEQLRTTMPPDDAADLMAAIGNLDIPASAIGRAVRARNLKCPDESLNRHRRGECSCRTS